MAAKKKDVQIVVDTAHLDGLDDIAEQCQRLGLRIRDRLADIGIVTGSIDEARIDSLREVEGVAQVEIGGRVDIEPPDADIQ